MSFAVYLVLSYVVPAALVLGCTIVWWRCLRLPWLFTAVAILSVVGLRGVVDGAYTVARISVGSGGFYLEHRSDTFDGALLLQGAVVAAVTVVIGFAVLRSLRNGLAKL